ncbi:MAG: substrate-binding domain-containing protein [Clostridia bacterium]|nr:substrate-binding domain-containing protein [Clostridia bacterium]
MVIRIYVHPEFKDTFWTQLSLKATNAEITRKRYTAHYIDVEKVTDIDFDKVFEGDEKKLLLYIGHSVSGTPVDLKYLTDHGVHVILLNYESSVLSGSCSKVLLNYRDGMQKSISYLTANKHDKIALFGINPNSSTDMLKDSYFVEYLRERGGNPTRDIYYNYGSISGCFSRFAENYTDYNAVICSNDVVALALINYLKGIGVRIPEDMYVTACGGSSILSSMANTTITTVFADQYELGRQAVLTYSYLYKNPCDVALSVKVEARLTVRQSTNFDPDPGHDLVTTLKKQVPNVDFYDDPVIQSIFRIEALLLSCDELDRGILEGILAGETYPSIAERLYTSENVISYRIKRMCKITETSKKSELVTLLSPYLK